MRSTIKLMLRTKRQRLSAMRDSAAAVRKAAGMQASVPVLVVLLSPEPRFVLVSGLPVLGLEGGSFGQMQANPTADWRQL